MRQDPGNIRINDYSYDLPINRIARYPLPERDLSRLLVWDGATIKDHIFRELPSLLRKNSLLVFNNTRVIRARLLFTRDNGAKVEIFCLEPVTPHDFSQNLSSTSGVEWKCLIGNLKRWKTGWLSSDFEIGGKKYILNATRIAAEADTFVVRFEWNDLNVTFGEVLDALGHVPIPPYLCREDEESDISRYQTMYARIEGSVAAPTAGLHFTPRVIDDLDRAGIDRSEVTLHVSAGTFRPVKSEKISDHKMHTEHFFITHDTIQGLIERDIIAVGTTTVRTLESLYWLGAAIADGRMSNVLIPSVSQWEPYDHDSKIDKDLALECLIGWMRRVGMSEIEVKTDIIIVPGYRFRVINGMLTNFHQPGSTLLLLVAAFAGNSWRNIYRHALSSEYRFLSYGDSMLLLPHSG